MIITEAELREAWKNGRGTMPEIPPDARLTPAARDFLAAIGSYASANPQSAAAGSVANKVSGGSMELIASKGRLILTSADIDDILVAHPETLIVHPEVTITDVARDRLRNAGVRIIPFNGDKPVAQGPVSHNMTAQPPSAMLAAQARAERTETTAQTLQNGQNDQLFNAVKKAVVARLNGHVEDTLVDEVLKRVLSALK